MYTCSETKEAHGLERRQVLKTVQAMTIVIVANYLKFCIHPGDNEKQAHLSTKNHPSIIFAVMFLNFRQRELGGHVFGAQVST